MQLLLHKQCCYTIGRYRGAFWRDRTTYLYSVKNSTRFFVPLTFLVIRCCMQFWFAIPLQFLSVLNDDCDTFYTRFCCRGSNRATRVLYSTELCNCKKQITHRIIECKKSYPILSHSLTEAVIALQIVCRNDIFRARLALFYKFNSKNQNSFLVRWFLSLHLELCTLIESHQVKTQKVICYKSL
jgi:hypothetical protein